LDLAEGFVYSIYFLESVLVKEAKYFNSRQFQLKTKKTKRGFLLSHALEFCN